ncbi:unnamed protein product [Fructobacillus tropaeoli]|nr:unnamed protein product [Fructobacillus tropaeoli]
MTGFKPLQVSNLFLIQDNYRLFQKRLHTFQFCWYIISAIITLLSMNFSHSSIWYFQLIFLLPILFPVFVFQLMIDKKRLLKKVYGPFLRFKFLFSG